MHKKVTSVDEMIPIFTSEEKYLKVSDIKSPTDLFRLSWSDKILFSMFLWVYNDMCFYHEMNDEDPTRVKNFVKDNFSENLCKDFFEWCDIYLAFPSEDHKIIGEIVDSFHRIKQCNTNISPKLGQYLHEFTKLSKKKRFGREDFCTYQLLEYLYDRKTIFLKMIELLYGINFYKKLTDSEKEFLDKIENTLFSTRNLCNKKFNTNIFNMKSEEFSEVGNLSPVEVSNFINNLNTREIIPFFDNQDITDKVYYFMDSKNPNMSTQSREYNLSFFFVDTNGTVKSHNKNFVESFRLFDNFNPITIHMITPSKDRYYAKPEGEIELSKSYFEIEYKVFCKRNEFLRYYSSSYIMRECGKYIQSELVKRFNKVGLNPEIHFEVEKNYNGLIFTFDKMDTNNKHAEIFDEIIDCTDIIMEKLYIPLYEIQKKYEKPEEILE